MVTIIRILMTMLALVGMASSHEETFTYEVDAYERSGDMNLRIFPTDDGKRSIYEFRTTQIGVYSRLGFRVAFQWLRNVKDNSSTDYEAAVF